MVPFHRKHMRRLAVAMNNLGGKSNTGEGGEDLERLSIGRGRTEQMLCDQAGSKWTFWCNK